MIVIEHKNGPHAIRFNRTATGYIEIQTPRGRRHLISMRDFLEVLQALEIGAFDKRGGKQ